MFEMFLVSGFSIGKLSDKQGLSTNHSNIHYNPSANMLGLNRSTSAGERICASATPASFV